MFKKHGLTGNTKQRVFDALYQRQHGTCFICGFTDEEMLARCAGRPGLRRSQSVHYRLYIDHCHTSGMIRGLLCEPCNLRLGLVENLALKPKPETMRKIYRDGSIELIAYPEEMFAQEMDTAGRWLQRHQERVLEYMQKERWLPRKDILFHLRGEP